MNNKNKKKIRLKSGQTWPYPMYILTTLHSFALDIRQNLTVQYVNPVLFFFYLPNTL